MSLQLETESSAMTCVSVLGLEQVVTWRLVKGWHSGAR